MESRVFNLLLSTLLVVISIVLLTKISGNDMASIYVKKGNLRLGLIIGLATFLFFLVTSLPISIGLFGGQDVASEQLVTFAPWIAAPTHTKATNSHHRASAFRYSESRLSIFSV